MIKIFPKDAYLISSHDGTLHKIAVPYIFFNRKWREDVKYYTSEQFHDKFGYSFKGVDHDTR